MMTVSIPKQETKPFQLTNHAHHVSSRHSAAEKTTTGFLQLLRFGAI